MIIGARKNKLVALRSRAAEMRPLEAVERLLLARLIKLSLTLALSLNSALILAQLIKLARALSWGGASWLDSLGLLKGLLKLSLSAAPVMWEATAPLLALLSCLVCYHGLQTEGFVLAWLSEGRRPLRLLTPALALGLALALSAQWCAHQLTPSALQSLSRSVAELAARSMSQGLERAPRGAPLTQLLTMTQRSTESTDERSRPQFSALIDEERRLWLWSLDEQTFARAELTEGAEALIARGDGELRLMLKRAELWSPLGRASLGSLKVSWESERLKTSLKSLSGPNSKASESLDESAHERFTLHKRSALPLSSVAWALLGALLGLSGSAIRSTLIASLTVGAAYSALRFLELRARFEGGDPLWAAWLPTLSLSLCALIALRYSAVMRPQSR